MGRMGTEMQARAFFGKNGGAWHRVAARGVPGAGARRGGAGLVNAVVIVVAGGEFGI